MSGSPELKEIPPPDAPHPFVISMFFPKGGVGKSSMTMCLATVLASLGKKVLLIDLDPQCNLTSTLLHGSIVEEKEEEEGRKEGEDEDEDEDEDGEEQEEEKNDWQPLHMQPMQDPSFAGDIEKEAKQDLKEANENNKKKKNIADYFEVFFEGKTHSGSNPLEGRGEIYLGNKCPRPLKPFDAPKYQEKEGSTVDHAMVKKIFDKIFLIPGTPEVSCGTAPSPPSWLTHSLAGFWWIADHESRP